MNLDNQIVRKICPDAQYRENNGDDSVYCECGKGKNPPDNYYFMQIEEGKVCVATSFFETGHNYLGSSVDIDKMRGCPYNKKNNSK